MPPRRIERLLVVLLTWPWLGACGSSSPVQPPQPAPPTPAATPVPGPTPRADLKPVIEALFMGSGPLRPTEGTPGCMFPGFWSGFPRGTRVTVKVSTTVSADSLAALRDAAGDVAVATGGAIAATIEVVDDPDPRPLQNEVTAAVVRDPVAEGCLTDVGCTIPRFLRPGVLFSARVVLPAIQTPNAFVHDAIGHGVMGFCHIDGNLIGGPERSLMSFGAGVFSDDIALHMTSLDIEAAQAVYRVSLNPGATRADFVQVGLIDASAQAGAARTVPPGTIDALPLRR